MTSESQFGRNITTDDCRTGSNLIFPVPKFLNVAAEEIITIEKMLFILKMFSLISVVLPLSSRTFSLALPPSHVAQFNRLQSLNPQFQGNKPWPGEYNLTWVISFLTLL